MIPQEFAVEIELYGERDAMGIEKMCVEIRHEPVWYLSEVRREFSNPIYSDNFWY